MRVGERLDDGHEIEEAVCQVERDHAAGLHMLQIDADSLRRDQMNRNRVAREGVDGQHIETLRGLALEVQTRVTEHCLDLGVAIVQISKVAVRDAGDRDLLAEH